MRTVEQLIGAAVVFATDQVTVCELPPGQVIPDAEGYVSTNGPAVAFVVTVKSV